MWTTGRVTLWPNGFFLGHHFDWRVLMRRRFFEELDALQADPAHEPKGLIRDAAHNHNLPLPSACRDEMLHGLPRAKLAAHPLLGPYLKDFFWPGRPAGRGAGSL